LSYTHPELLKEYSVLPWSAKRKAGGNQQTEVKGGSGTKS
jgi:hypothetical protein